MSSTLRSVRYQPSDCSSVLTLWASAVGPAFPLREAVLAGRLEDPRGVRPSVLAKCVWADNILVAFGYLTARDRAVQESTHMRLQAVVVHPDYQHRGLGRRLAQSLLADGASTGGLSAEVGGGTDYLWPGVPDSLDSAAPFVEAIGYSLGGVSYDLRSGPLTGIAARANAARLEAMSVNVRPASREQIPGLLAFVGEEFDADWATDIDDHIGAGGRPDEYLLATDLRAAILGFARIHTAGSEPVGPPMFWASRRPPDAGGLGPIGVSAPARGRGLGSALLGAAAVELEHRGATDIVIDFTDRLAFYGAQGFEPWMRFQHATWAGSRPPRKRVR